MFMNYSNKIMIICYIIQYDPNNKHKNDIELYDDSPRLKHDKWQ